MLSSGMPTRNQLTVIFTRPPAMIEYAVSFSLPVAYKTAVVMSEKHTNIDAIPKRHKSSVPDS